MRKADDQGRVPGAPWGQVEVAAIVADHLDMLRKELRGEPYNKAEHRRRLSAKLNGRTAGSIEFKHANISAVLVNHEFGGYIEGYKPRSNYQDLLATEVMEQVAADVELQRLLAASVDAVPEPNVFAADVRDVFVPIPRFEKPKAVYERPTSRAVVRTSESYLEREARNQRLGAAGEAFVLEVEDRRLRAAGLHALANRIEQKSRTEGDGLGFDILSFDERGAERFIEVKTTNFGAFTPFYASANEVRVSTTLADHYSLYRVFGFRRTPRIYTLDGDLSRHVALEPVSYRASIR